MAYEAMDHVLFLVGGLGMIHVFVFFSVDFIVFFFLHIGVADLGSLFLSLL